MNFDLDAIKELLVKVFEISIWALVIGIGILLSVITIAITGWLGFLFVPLLAIGLSSSGIKIISWWEKR